MSADLEKLTVEEFFESSEALRSLKENLEVNLNGMGCPEEIRDGLMRVNMIIIRQAFLQVRSERLAASWPSDGAIVNWATEFLASFNRYPAYMETVVWLRSQVKPAPLPDSLSPGELIALAQSAVENLDPDTGFVWVYERAWRDCEKRYRGEG